MRLQNHLPAAGSCELGSLQMVTFYLFVIPRRGVHTSCVFYAASPQGCKYWVIQGDPEGEAGTLRESDSLPGTLQERGLLGPRGWGW